MPTESNSPAATMKMWRYMSMSRFLWVLQRKKLWLSRADLLGDPWEISLAGDQLQYVIDRHPPTPHPLSAAPRETAMERVRRIIPIWRQMTYVNCWCAFEHESHALWRVYCGATEGVALETNYSKLVSSLYSQTLRQVSYEKPGSNKQTPTLDELVTKKRPMFEYEHEFRIVQSLEIPSGALGLPIDWNPEEHLVSIRVHPEADASFMETVATSVADYAPALADRVIWSDMRAPPPA
jgi:hypothetical protein